MAMSIVFHFDDDKTALQFAEEHEEEGLVGIFKVPTLFCEGGHTAKRVTGFTRGKRYGWYVCAVCKKPSKAAWQDPYGVKPYSLDAAIMAITFGHGGPFGRNLLRDFFDVEST